MSFMAMTGTTHYYPKRDFLLFDSYLVPLDLFTPLFALRVVVATESLDIALGAEAEELNIPSASKA
jgi:hypothetical protein